MIMTSNIHTITMAASHAVRNRNHLPLNVYREDPKGIQNMLPKHFKGLNRHPTSWMLLTFQHKYKIIG